MSNCKKTIPDPVAALMEVFPLCQRVILNTLDFKDLGFTKTQLSILFALTVETPLTMTNLARYIVSSKEQTTRAVAPLVRAGYLERTHDESNRKLVLVRLTPEGHRIMKHKQDELRTVVSAKIQQLSEEDKEDFCKALDTTLQVLKELQ